MKKILKARNLTHSYDGKNYLFENFNYQFEQGQMYAFMGASGCGKSTLLYLLSGLLQPSELGEVSFEDSNGPRKPESSFIFSDPFLIPELTCHENLTFCSQDHLEMSRLSKRLGLTEHLDQYPDSLSSGQKQRLSALRALLLAKDVLFADEPTSHLDKGRSLAFIEEIQVLVKEKGLIFLCVTHDHLLSKCFDHIINL